MADFEEVTVTLQSGTDVKIHAWPGHGGTQPLVFVALESLPADWNEFASLVGPSHSPILADISSAMDLLMLIWEIGEPVLILSQGQVATNIVSKLVTSAPAAATSIIICDGLIHSDQLNEMHEISTLIMQGRQSSALTHETAVQLHGTLRHSTLIELENCGDFPAKNNPDAAASAVNWFLSGPSNSDDEFTGSEPIDPKA